MWAGPAAGAVGQGPAYAGERGAGEGSSLVSWAQPGGGALRGAGGGALPRPGRLRRRHRCAARADPAQQQRELADAAAHVAHVRGLRAEGRAGGLPAGRGRLQRHQPGQPRPDAQLSQPRRDGLRAARRLRQREGAARRVPGLAGRPGLAAAAAPHPAGRRAARRARRRLRRRLRPRRAGGVQRRQPAAVHALRHLPDGHLLQQRPRRLRRRCATAAATRPTRTSDNPRWTFDQFTAAAEFATHPRAGTRGVYVDPIAGRPRPVHLLRWWPALRRRPGPDLAGLLQQRHPGRADPGAAAAAQPPRHADADASSPRPSPAAVVRAGQARHDRRLPLAGAASCARCRAWTST